MVHGDGIRILLHQAWRSGHHGNVVRRFLLCWVLSGLPLERLVLHGDMRLWWRRWQRLRRRAHLPTATYIRAALGIPKWPDESISGWPEPTWEQFRGRVPQVGREACERLRLRVIGPARGCWSCVPSRKTPRTAGERLQDAAQHRRRYHSLPLERRREINRAKNRRRLDRLRRARAEDRAMRGQLDLIAAGRPGAHRDLVAFITDDIFTNLNRTLAGHAKEDKAEWDRIQAQRERERERFFRDV